MPHTDLRPFRPVGSAAPARQEITPVPITPPTGAGHARGNVPGAGVARFAGRAFRLPALRRPRPPGLACGGGHAVRYTRSGLIGGFRAGGVPSRPPPRGPPAKDPTPLGFPTRGRALAAAPPPHPLPDSGGDLQSGAGRVWGFPPRQPAIRGRSCGRGGNYLPSPDGVICGAIPHPVTRRENAPENHRGCGRAADAPGRGNFRFRGAFPETPEGSL
jgi:hypothetical protein